MDFIYRKEYLKIFREFFQKPLIKIITGVRGSGKTTLLNIFKNELSTQGIAKQNLVSINFEAFENKSLLDPSILHNYLSGKLIKGEMVYVFLDEIQHVPDFQKVISSLLINPGIDIYIAGSNTNLLSLNLAKLFTGRYIEIKMLPLSFKEYVEAKKSEESLQILYAQYSHTTSFPYALQFEKDYQITTYLEGLYNTIIVNDILPKGKLFEITTLQNLCAFLFDSIGSKVSTLKIVNTLSSSKDRKYESRTIERYLGEIKSSYLFYEAQKFNIKGRQILNIQPKYYCVDLGLHYNLFGHSTLDGDHVLENIVYLELIRRGYRVYVGKNEKTEIDFVAIRGNKKLYYQVSLTLRDKETLNRELKALYEVKDNYPKIILTLDEIPKSNTNGIITMNALEWLVSAEEV